MNREDWTVGSHAVRPAGKPGECFYCRQPLGGQHDAGCVIRSRTVVVRYTYELVLDVPEDWDPKQIEFHRNMGTWCASNSIGELKRLDDVSCLCSSMVAAYVREATVADEEKDQHFVGKLES